jgi:hypothetical protein
MAKLELGSNLPDPDGIYARLIAAHDGLDPQESAAFNARLILILLNHIGNDEVIAQALEAARR